MILFGILFKGDLLLFLDLVHFTILEKLRKGNPELKEETVIKTAKELYKDGKAKYQSLDEQQQKYALGGGVGAVAFLILLTVVMGIKPKVTIAVVDQAGSPVPGIELDAAGSGFAALQPPPMKLEM